MIQLSNNKVIQESPGVQTETITGYVQDTHRSCLPLMINRNSESNLSISNFKIQGKPSESYRAVYDQHQYHS